VHGPWLLKILPDGDIQAHQIPLASLCYVSLDIDISGLAYMGDVESHITREIEKDLHEHHAYMVHLRRVVYRLTLTGHTSLYRELKHAEPDLGKNLEISRDNALATIDRVTVDTMPAYNLKKLAQIPDALGILAQLLLDIETGPLDEKSQQLVSNSKKELESIFSTRAYSPLRSINSIRQTPTPEKARQLLLRQGRILLEEMQNQIP